MAKYVPMDLLKSLSGAICEHSDTYFAVRNGTKYTGKICNPRTSDYSQAELDRQAKFKAAHAAAIVRYNDATKQASDLAAFKNQKKKKTLLGYLTSIAYANTAKDSVTDAWTTTWPA